MPEFNWSLSPDGIVVTVVPRRGETVTTVLSWADFAAMIGEIAGNNGGEFVL